MIEAIKDTKAGEDEIKEFVGVWEVLNKVSLKTTKYCWTAF